MMRFFTVREVELKNLAALLISLMCSFLTAKGLNNLPEGDFSLESNYFDNSQLKFTTDSSMNVEECVIPINLEQRSQKFVLGTKQLIIPGYPGVFNPSIVYWKGKILLSFRIRNKHKTERIGLVWLDKNFNIVSNAFILEMPVDYSKGFNYEEDARLIVIQDSLFVVYNNRQKLRGIPRMHVAEVFFDGNKFFTTSSDRLLSFENQNKRRTEKNWTPFVYQNKLLLAYSTHPHKIFQLLGNSTCETIASTQGNIQWEWGELRGGTPAQLINNDYYLAFFHSTCPMSTTHSKGITMRHYFIGAYTFLKDPPFSMRMISREPIIGRDFYSGPPYHINGPMQVVFPGGFVMDDKFIWIVYGRQDCELWIMRIDKKGLLNSLVPVFPKK